MLQDGAPCRDSEDKQRHCIQYDVHTIAPWLLVWPRHCLNPLLRRATIHRLQGIDWLKAGNKVTGGQFSQRFPCTQVCWCCFRVFSRFASHQLGETCSGVSVSNGLRFPLQDLKYVNHTSAQRRIRPIRLTIMSASELLHIHTSFTSEMKYQHVICFCFNVVL